MKYQYLYGDDLLVAPVYLPNQTTWTVYLPRQPSGSHSWVFLWNSTLVSPGGADVTVPTLLGQPPAFYRNTSRFVDSFRKIGGMLPVPPPPLPPPTDPTDPTVPTDPTDPTAPSSRHPPGRNAACPGGALAVGLSLELIFACVYLAFAIYHH